MIARSQFDLFGTTVASTSVVGLIIEMPKPCPACGCTNAVVGSSKAMHHASLRCENCDRFAGWMSAESYRFLSDVVDEFGRPSGPVIVRKTGSNDV